MRRIDISFKLFRVIGLILLFQVTAIWSMPNQKKGEPNSQTSGKADLYEMKFRVVNRIDQANYWKNYFTDLLTSVNGIEYIGMTHNSQMVKIGYVPSIINMAKLHSLLEGSLKTSLKESTHLKATQFNEIHRKGIESISPDTSFSNVSFKSLTTEEAEADLKNHTENMKLDGIDIENCYVIKVEFKGDGFINSGNDWHKKTRLVDESGKLIKPVSWFIAPGEENELKAPTYSGVLLFPKVPLLKLGLTLRFLRANGDGYDSYIIERP